MNRLALAALAIILFVIPVFAQIGISPLNSEFAKKAKDQVTITNGGLFPVAVTLEAKSLTMSDGHFVLYDIDPAVIQVKLHETSGRIPPKSSRTFDYDIKCDRCVVLLFASITPIQKMKIDDGSAGVRVVMHFGETVYVCEKAKSCRQSFFNSWKEAKTIPTNAVSANALPTATSTP